MTVHTVGAEFSFVNHRFGMTSGATLGGALEHIVLVASRAFHHLVHAGKFERGQIVVEFSLQVGQRSAGVFPSCRGVATAALGAELASVDLRLGMAGSARFRCSFEHVAYVA